MAEHGVGWWLIAPLICNELIHSFLFMYFCTLPLCLFECNIFRVGTGSASQVWACLAQQDPDAGFGALSPGVAQAAAIILSLELLSSLGVTGLLWECKHTTPCTNGPRTGLREKWGMSPNKQPQSPQSYEKESFAFSSLKCAMKHE